MKRHLQILLAIMSLAVAFTVSVQAQTASGQKLIANIPFAFNVANKNLPAGKYMITVVNPTSDQKILKIRSANGKASAITITTTVTGNVSENGKLVFHRYGETYFFMQAQMAGDATSLAAVKSKNVERAEKHAATVAGTRTVVVIFAG
jgi:hypothetical protein